MLAGQDIDITTGKYTVDISYFWKLRNGGVGSRRGTYTTQSGHYEKNPISSELLGETVTIAAGRDVNLLSSNTINRGNTLIKAGRDITSDVDTALTKDESTSQETSASKATRPATPTGKRMPPSASASHWIRPKARPAKDT